MFARCGQTLLSTQLNWSPTYFLYDWKTMLFWCSAIPLIFEHGNLVKTIYYYCLYRDQSSSSNSKVILILQFSKGTNHHWYCRVWSTLSLYLIEFQFLKVIAATVDTLHFVSFQKFQQRIAVSIYILTNLRFCEYVT